MAATQLPTGTVTFLFTGIEGSTGLLQRLGPERCGALLARHNGHLRDVLERHDGIEVDRQGDGLFAIFRSAEAAVGAAVDAQRLLARQGWPDA
jgi:class 3 adenylate cyclase